MCVRFFSLHVSDPIFRSTGNNNIPNLSSVILVNCSDVKKMQHTGSPTASNRLDRLNISPANADACSGCTSSLVQGDGAHKAPLRTLMVCVAFNSPNCPKRCTFSVVTGDDAVFSSCRVSCLLVSNISPPCPRFPFPRLKQEHDYGGTMTKGGLKALAHRMWWKRR